MSYRISYNSGKANNHKIIQSQTAATAFGCFLVVSAVIFRLLEPDSSEQFRDLILPEVQKVIALLEDSDMADSVHAFYQDIIADLKG